MPGIGILYTDIEKFLKADWKLRAVVTNTMLKKRSRLSSVSPIE